MSTKQWSVIGDRWSVLGRVAADASARRHSPPTTHRPLPTGFTLVELLVVITILGLLSSMILFALAAAGESAKVAKTQSIINKLNAIVMAKYETYRTRRVPVDVALVAAYYKSLPSGDPRKRHIPASVQPTQALAYTRLSVLRELMRLEMPDGFTDINDDPITQWKVGNQTKTMQRPAASIAYKRLLDSIPSPNSENVSAECLYMLITKGCDDPDVMEQFSPADIGDTDNDRLKEFLDGWGRPIYFLRWAPAYVSPLQPWNFNVNPITPPGHDPFDPLNVCENFVSPTNDTFPIYPLIYSAGPDGVPDITADNQSGTPIHYRDINNNPFDKTIPIVSFVGLAERVSSGNSNNGGNANKEEESFDNITNHEIAGR